MCQNSIIILLASPTTILEIKIILKRIISLTSDEPPLRKYKIKIVNVYKGFLMLNCTEINICFFTGGVDMKYKF